MTLEKIRRCALLRMRDDFKAFEKTPNAARWTRLQSALLVHQQVQQIRAWDLDKVEALPDAEWDTLADSIVRIVAGDSISNVLRKYS